MTEQTIFATALEHSGTERVAYLDLACAGNEMLRRQVEELLTAHERSGEFLDEPAVAQIVAKTPPAEQQTKTFTGDSANADDRTAISNETPVDESLTFLKPPTRANSIGRLAHYEVLEKIGSGGFGTVLRAFDERLHRVVAIKVLSPQLSSSATARARFNREARAGAAIRDEHVVNIHAVSDETEPIPYLVMEYVAGQTLQQKLDRTGPLGVKEIVRISQQIACGLAAAHATGHIHRDIKPGNILLENGVERVKITDFGLARAADDASISQSGIVAGTPMYMAPEQAQGSAIDHRADLFSLGSVMYAMCTGRPPFRASTTMATLKRVCEDTPRAIREINPEMPDWLEAIVAKLHAKNPAHRFQTAKEVAELLGQHLANLKQPETVAMPARVEAPTNMSATEVVSEASAPIARRAGTTAQRPRRKRRWLTVGVLTLIAGLLTGAFTLRGVRDSFALWSGKALLTINEEEWGMAQDVEVLVTQHGRVVSALNSRNNRRVYLEPGVYSLSCQEDPISFVPVDIEPTQITLKSGERQSAIVRAVPTGLLDLHVPRGTVVTFEPRGPRRKESHVESDLRGALKYQFLEGAYQLIAWHPDGTKLTRRFTIRADRLPNGWLGRTTKVDLRAAFDESSGWMQLFNGKDLTGWKPGKKSKNDWIVEQGKLIGAMGPGYLFSTKAYENFHLRAEVQMNLEGNSGIAFRDRFQVEIRDDPQCPTGSLLDVQESEAKKLIRYPSPPFSDKDWFTVEIKAQGPTISVRVNDGPWLSAQDPRPAGAQAGPLELEVQKNTVVLFRKIEIKELPAAEPKPADPVRPFALIPNAGGGVLSYPTLGEAIGHAKDGDTIVIHGNGPFNVLRVKLDGKALTLRAAPGVRPVIRRDFREAPSEPLFLTDRPLVLEGLEIVLEGVDHRYTPPVVKTSAPFAATNCRFRTVSGCIYSAGKCDINLRNCELYCPVGAGVWCWDPVEGQVIIENCIMTGNAALSFGLSKPADPKLKSGCKINLAHNSFLALSAIHVQFGKPKIDWPELGSPTLAFAAKGNAFDCDLVLNTTGDGQVLPRQTEAGTEGHIYKRVLDWKGENNAYRGQTFGDYNLANAGGKLAKSGWAKWWGPERVGSFSGNFVYREENLTDKIRKRPRELKPHDFLPADGSPSKEREGAKRNRGADIDLVGPGKAFDEWRKSADYKQWQKSLKIDQPG